MSSSSIPIMRRGAPPIAALWSLLFLTIVFLVAFEQGAVSAGTPLLHEAFHDARHLLGVPCH